MGTRIASSSLDVIRSLRLSPWYVEWVVVSVSIERNRGGWGGSKESEWLSELVHDNGSYSSPSISSRTVP
jgi:hypothetical protein